MIDEKVRRMCSVLQYVRDIFPFLTTGKCGALLYHRPMVITAPATSKRNSPWVTACKLDYLLLIPNPLKVVHHGHPPGREGEWKVIFLPPRHVLYRLWSFANIVNDTRSLLILNVIRLREIGQMYLARSLIFCWQFISGVVNQHMPTREVDLHIL